METVWLRNVNLGRLHICIGRNDDIRQFIDKGVRKSRSFRFDRVPGMIAISARVGVRFINIDIL